MKKTIFILLVGLISAAFVNAQDSYGPVPQRSGNQHSGEMTPQDFRAPLGGTMVHSWNNEGTPHYGMFDVATPGNTLSIVPSTAINFVNAGEMVIGDPTKFYSIGSMGNTWLINVTSGTETPLGTVTGWTGNAIFGMALDHSTGIYYICDEIDNLYTIDMNTLVATLVGNFGTSSGYMIGITFDGGGNLWGHDLQHDAIYSINKTTGLATSVGLTGFNANFGQGMGFDPNTNSVVLTAFNSSTFQAEYRSVNTATGATTFLGKIGPPGVTTQFTSCCIAGTPPPIPISNWAIYFGIFLIGLFVIYRFRRKIA